MSFASSWMSIVLLILFLGLMSGFWAGLIGLWKARRGVARSLMAIGIILGTIGPLCLFAIPWTYNSSNLAAIQIFNMIGGLMIPIGMVFFSVGFALHGFAVGRMANRAEELEQLTAAMSEEINRLREGGPIA